MSDPRAESLPSPSPSAVTLYLVRHGRTRFNTEGLMQGWSDSELTADGRAGVEATARALRSVPLAAAYTSPSGRTVTTAGVILDHHPDVPLTRHDGLRELHFGEAETRPEVDVFAELDPREVFGGIFTGQGEGFPGGEGGREYLGRVARAFLEIERAHRPGESVLVVSHGVTLMAYLQLGAEVVLRPLVNASVSVVEVREGGLRSVRMVGHDPSATAPEALSEPLARSLLRLEDVVTWTAPSA